MSGQGEEEEEEGRGRSKARRAAKSFDVLVLRLLELPVDKFKGLPASKELREVLDETRFLGSKSARRRTMRRLASMLRERSEEVVAIEAFLAGKPYRSVAGDEEFRDLLALRDSLLVPSEGDEAIAEAVARFPRIDRLSLAEFVAQAQEGAKGAKNLYRFLRQAEEEAEEELSESSSQD